MKRRLHVRVDNRLLHGQVVQFWIPHLEIEHLIIANDDAVSNKTLVMIYHMSVPENVKVTVTPIFMLADSFTEADKRTTMVLFNDIHDAIRAVMCGFKPDHLTLGNIHKNRDRERITDSVYMSREEIESLVRLNRTGMQIVIQVFPGEVLNLALDEGGGAKWLEP